MPTKKYTAIAGSVGFKRLRRAVRAGRFLVRVTPSGGLEVDATKLFKEARVQKDVKALKAIPLASVTD